MGLSLINGSLGHFADHFRRAKIWLAGTERHHIVTSFRIWWVALFYVVAMIALGFHLFHGAWSSVRSIGVSPPSPQPLHRKVSVAIAILVWAAFTAVPVAVFSGIVR